MSEMVQDTWFFTREGDRLGPVTFAELKTRLRGYGAEAKPPIIRIRGDGKVFYEKIVQLMDEMKKNNLVKFTIDTQAPN